MLKGLLSADDEKKMILIDNADPGKTYFCPDCREPLVQRRGKIRAWHFAHFPTAGAGVCHEKDTWHYDMSEWHMNWQRRFPEDSIEIRATDSAGNRHRADVLIGNVVIEFQHSPLSCKEFRERNNFWTDLGYRVVWVVDVAEKFPDELIPVDNFVFRWDSPLKIFKEIRNIRDEKALVFFQTRDTDSDEEYPLEPLLSSYFGFTSIEMDGRAFSVREFVDAAINNPDVLFMRPVARRSFGNVPPREEKVVDQTPKTLYELWKPEYQFVIVTNTEMEQEFCIRNNGRGEMEFEQFINGRVVIGCYTNYNRAQKRYYYSQRKYRIAGAARSIWTLKYARSRNENS